MKKTSLLVLVFGLGLATEVAKADFVFGEPNNLGPTVNSESYDDSANISTDSLELYFLSERPGGHGEADIWVTTRTTVDEAWGMPVNLGSTINTSSYDSGPSISSNGLSLYFTSFLPGGQGEDDLWVTKRTTVSDTWGSPVNLGSTANGPTWDYDPSISSDGLELYFTSNRPGGYGDTDIWVTTRATIDDPWGEPDNLGPVVNTEIYSQSPSISADGLALFFESNRSGGVRHSDIWMTRRATKNDSWTEPVNLGPPVNTTGYEKMPDISADGRTLYFGSDRSGGVSKWDLWQVLIDPVVDLNGDGIVDAADMCIVVDHWGEDYPLCDVGPMPWGDGVVDVQDLIVLAEHLFEVFPSAETAEVNEDNDGGQIELELGKLLVVTLESNPSTGYRWELVENNESILKQFGQAEFKSSETGDPPIVGAGGWEIFRFKAVSAGQMTLKLVYHRSWEDVEPLKTFSIQVVIP